MKKIYLSLLGIGLMASAAQAQTPVKKSMSIFHKISATWCNPCGSWGWNLANEIVTATEGKALYVGLFPDSDPSFGNNEFYSTTSVTLSTQITFGGFPDFGVNAIEKTSANTSGGGINPTGIKNDCVAAVNAFNATTPVVSPAGKLTISGNTATVAAKVQFWAATSGEYYLAAYLMEDGAMHIQNGQSGSVAHHAVLRTSMSTGATAAWGEQIATGSINENQTYTKNFTFNITDSKWDKTKLKVYTIVWKKEGSVYKFMNASEGTSGATAVEELINTSSLNIFPNPVSNTLSLKMDVVKSCAATLTVTDVTGRLINTTATNLKQGANTQTVNTASLTPGLYFLNIQTDNGTIQKKFVKE